MPILNEAGLSAEKLQEIASMVKSASAEAVQLRIVERFLSEIERRLMKTSPRIFDIERVRTALQILKTLSTEDDPEEYVEAEFKLDQEFHLWRTLIEDRDKAIETYHFRRFCDSAQQPIEPEIFTAMAAFYLKLKPSPSVLSKFDLVITRLYSTVDENGVRSLACGRSELASRVIDTLGSRDEWLEIDSETDAAVAKIDLFTAEVLEFTDFETMVHSKLFERYRDFKRELGASFFHPEIVAAAIDCNITVGNAFNRLLEAADEKLGERLRFDIGLPSVLHDPSPEARAHAGELFSLFFGLDNTGASADELGFLEKLIKNAAPRSEKLEPNHENEGSVPAQERLAPFLKTLTAENPDTGLLREHMSRFTDLQILDLSDFLFNEDGRPDTLCRRVLGLIIWSSEFRDNEMQERRELSEATQQEALMLLRKGEELASALRIEIESADPIVTNRMLTVLNALLESSIKLERSIIRYTSRNLAVIPAEPEPEPVEPTRKQQLLAVPTINRWLLAATILVTLFSGVVYIVGQQFGNMLPVALDSEEIDINSLPHRDHMDSARRHGQTLYILANDTWQQLPPSTQKEYLEELIDFPGKFRYQSIAVLSPDGRPLADISPNGIFVDEGSAPTAGASDQ